MALLFLSKIDNPGDWVDALKASMPELEVRVWPEIGDPASVEAALVWKPPKGELRRFPNLRLIASIGAGVDHMLADPDLPGVPLARVVDPGLTHAVSEYVLLGVLRHFRRLAEYEEQQRAGKWRHLPQPSAASCRIGILGLGVLGVDSARKLTALGFTMAGWTRRPKAIDGVRCFHGSDGLDRLLGQSDILVCQLPLTPATTGVLNAATLGKLPQSAYVINPGRGGHIVEEDLLRLIDAGHLAGAMLDVFRKEPLPTDHAFWKHPKVIVTPHIAGITDPWSTAAQITENIRRIRRGLAPNNLVDRTLGY